MTIADMLKFRYIRAKNNTPKFFVYILKCSDGKYYTGYSEQLGYRYIQHKNGLGAKFTQKKDIKLVYFEAHSTKEEALRREKDIRQAPRHYRDMLVVEFSMLMKILKDDLII